MSLEEGNDQNAIINSLQLSGTLGRVMEGCAIRFISIMNTLSFNPGGRVVEMLSQSMVRFDMIIMTYNHIVEELAKDIPGSLIVIDDIATVAQHAKELLQQNSRYHVIANLRARGAAIDWIPPFIPITRKIDNKFWIPVTLTDSETFGVKLFLLPNQDSFIFQLVMRYTQVFNDRVDTITRVISKEFQTSENKRAVMESINPRIVRWFYTYEKEYNEHSLERYKTSSSFYLQSQLEF